MTSPLVLKLSHGADLAAADRKHLANLGRSHVRTVPARRDLIEHDDNPRDVRIVTSGIACRYKTLPGGGRSIMAFLLPGDFCDIHVAILDHMDHTIGTITECEIAEIPQPDIDEIGAGHPQIRRAFWWATLVDLAISREWLVSMGRRHANHRIAHLFCELLVRYQTIGFATERSYRLNVTQEDIADALGLSTVHVNRTLQQLREDALVSMEGGKITIESVETLWEYADFDPTYLHRRPN